MKCSATITPTSKILEKIKEIRNDIFLVGFKAEYDVKDEVLINRGYELLKSADADLIVANDVGKEKRGFDVETNEVFIIDKDRNVKHIELDNKRVIVNKVLDEICIKIKD